MHLFGDLQRLFARTAGITFALAFAIAVSASRCFAGAVEDAVLGPLPATLACSAMAIQGYVLFRFLQLKRRKEARLATMSPGAPRGLSDRAAFAAG